VPSPRKDVLRCGKSNHHLSNPPSRMRTGKEVISTEFSLPAADSLSASPLGTMRRKLLGSGDGREIPSGEHIVKEAQQFGVNQPVRCQNLSAVQQKMLAGKVRDLPAGLLHQQNAGCRVP